MKEGEHRAKSSLVCSAGRRGKKRMIEGKAHVGNWRRETNTNANSGDV